MTVSQTLYRANCREGWLNRLINHLITPIMPALNIRSAAHHNVICDGWINPHIDTEYTITNPT
jgi:hypothetical protein